LTPSRSHHVLEDHVLGLQVEDLGDFAHVLGCEVERAEGIQDAGDPGAREAQALGKLQLGPVKLGQAGADQAAVQDRLQDGVTGRADAGETGRRFLYYTTSRH